jgi:hypothetical protein
MFVEIIRKIINIYTGWTILFAHMKNIDNFSSPLTIEAIFCGVIEDACPVVLGGFPGSERKGGPIFFFFLVSKVRINVYITQNTEFST